MENKKILKLIDDNGKEMEYEILVAFKWIKTNKYYIVYTDNTKDENNDLKIYASIYYPNDSSRLDEINTEEEWQIIDDILKGMQKEDVIINA